MTAADVMDVPIGAALDHIGIAVQELAAAVRTYEALFPGVLRTGPIYEVPSQGVRLCFVTGGGTRLELLAPMRDDGPLARFLDRRGEGLHHLCFAIPSLEAELTRLAAASTPLVDRTPRPGHGGRVAFVHPRAAHGVLIELLERGAAPPARDDDSR